MPGTRHGSGNGLFGDDPEFTRRLLRLADAGLPPDVQLVPAPASEKDRMLSNDLDSGTVLVAGSVRRPERIIIVEFQVGWDPGKLSQWPQCGGEVATLRLPRTAPGDLPRQHA
jgi:hypothetical protein